MKAAQFDVKTCFAQALKQYREGNDAKGKRRTQSELAQELGYSLAQIQRWENPKKPDMPPTDQIVRIAEVLNMTTDQLLTGVKAKNIGIHRVTGLSDEAIETLKNRTLFESLYIKTVIEPLLSREEMLHFPRSLLRGAGIVSSMDEEPTEEEEYALSGINWSMLQRFNSIIEKAMWEIVRLGSKDSRVSEILKSGGSPTAAMDFKGAVFGPESEDKQ